MSGPSDRRGFLRGLATLPLIGGGVTLIGNPTRAAEPVTRELLDAYDEWLDLERSFLKFERYGPAGLHADYNVPFEAVYRNRDTGRLFDFRTCGRASGLRALNDRPSERAAVVLAAAGCDWRE